MKTKLPGFVATMAIGLFALTASAQARVQFSFLKDFAGWSAVQMPGGEISVIREERPSARIILFPEDTRQAQTKEEALTWIDDFKNKIASKYEQCAPIKAKELKPNGMGVTVQDRDKAPRCVLWMSGTKQGHLFANLHLDDGVLDRQSQPIQQAALVFMSLTAARIQGKEFLKKEGEEIDLARFVDLIPRQNIPERMIAGGRAIEVTNIAYAAIPGSDVHSTVAAQRAVPLFPDKTGNACSDWDPSYFSAETLVAAGVNSEWYSHAGMYERIPVSCRKFDWRESGVADGIEAKMGDGWAPLATALNQTDLGAVKAFEKGERLSIQFGDLGRLLEVVSGEAKTETLRSGDILFKPDGKFWAGNLANPSYPLGVYGSRGRYYVDGHIVVLDIDNGPILVGFGGKIETGGKVTALFLGGLAYGDL